MTDTADSPRPTSLSTAAADNSPATFEPLHPGAHWGFRVAQMIIAGVLWLPIAVLGRVLLGAFDIGVGWPLLLALLILLQIWAWRLGGRQFAAVRYRLDEVGLTIRRGVFWQSETHVPRSRVQHTDIQQGPLDRRLQLADLLIHTAGTQLATVRLSGLGAERAKTLRDLLLEGHDQHF